MKITRNPKFVLPVLLATSCAVILFFQNCSDVSFKDAAPQPESSLGVPDPVPTQPPSGGPDITPPMPEVSITVTPTPTPTLEPTPTPTPIVCPPGQVYKDGMCVPGMTQFTECVQFKELDVTDIPSLQDGMGVCYYKKILNKIAYQRSGSAYSQRANDILARDHQSHSNLEPVNPFVLGDNTQVLKFKAQRKLSITSSAVADVTQISNFPVKIDNFFLVEVEDSLLPKRMLARGTADAEPYVNNNSSQVGDILVKDGNGVFQPVSNFLSYAPRGTATVPVLSLVNEFAISIDVTSTFRFRMLDCGGSAEATELYLIIH